MFDFLGRIIRSINQSINSCHAWIHRSEEKDLLAFFFRLKFIRRARLSVWIDDSNACHIWMFFLLLLMLMDTYKYRRVFNNQKKDWFRNVFVINEKKEKKTRTNEQENGKKENLSRNQTDDNNCLEKYSFK